MIKVLSQIINLVPYHQARWEAVARLNDVELTVVQMRSNDDFEILETQKNDRAFPLETLGLSKKRTCPQKMLKLVNSVLDRHSPDVVVISGYSFPISLAFLLASAARRIPVVVCSESNQNDFVRNPQTEWIKSRVVKLCSAGLVGGTPQKEYLQELGIPEERIFTGYNAVDNDHFEHGSNKARIDSVSTRKTHLLPESYFIAVSRFTEKKNLPRLIDAYAEFRLRRPQSPNHLVIAGDGPLRHEIEKRIASHQMEAWVHLPGPVTYADLPFYFGLARGFIHASTTEQWGLVVNEALAAGLPAAVSHRCGCVRDLIEDEIHGRTFDPQSTMEIVQALEWIDDLVTDDLDKISRSARERVSEWSPSVFAKNLKLSLECSLNTIPAHLGIIDRCILLMLMLREERAQ